MIYFKKYVSLKVFDLNFFQNHFELTCILIRRAWDAQNITKSSFVILILLVASQYPDKTVYRRNKSVRCNTLFGTLHFKLIVDVLKNVWVDNSKFHSQKDLPNVKKHAWCIIFKHICRSLYLKTQREPYKIGKTKPDFVKSRIRRIAEAIQIANTINRFSYFFFFILIWNDVENLSVTLDGVFDLNYVLRIQDFRGNDPYLNASDRGQIQRKRNVELRKISLTVKR